MKDALKELKLIMEIPDQKHWDYKFHREQRLNDWIDKWILELEETQPILHQRKLSVEEHDILKTHLTNRMAERLTEDAASFDIGFNKLEAKICVIRRKARF